MCDLNKIGQWQQKKRQQNGYRLVNYWLRFIVYYGFSGWYYPTHRLPGLSMSNYKLISGTIPPISDAEWQDAFEHYKQFPEYNAYNTHFELEDFKAIYFSGMVPQSFRTLNRFGFYHSFPLLFIDKTINKVND